jgi:hypothetical protein
MNNKTYNIKLINGNIGFNDKVLSIPWYALALVFNEIIDL